MGSSAEYGSIHVTKRQASFTGLSYIVLSVFFIEPIEIGDDADAPAPRIHVGKHFLPHCRLFLGTGGIIEKPLPNEVLNESQRESWDGLVRH